MGPAHTSRDRTRRPGRVAHRAARSLVVAAALLSGGAADAAVLPVHEAATALPSRAAETTAFAPAGAPPDAPTSEGTGPGWVRPVPGAVHRGFDPPAHEWSAGHRGVDLAAPGGQVVRSPAPGTVVFAGAVAGKPVVVVAHPGGLRSTFEPATATTPRGERVGRGEPVARRAEGGAGGSAGHCGAQGCLHWGVLRGDAYLDPLALLGEDEPIVLLPTAGSW